MKTLYNIDRFVIIPETQTTIDTRSQCDILYKNKHLPLFTAPMTSVTNEKNWKVFTDKKINVVIPRSVSIEKRLELVNDECWVAFGLDEIDTYFLKQTFVSKNNDMKICIDIANGHMEKLHKISLLLKAKYTTLTLMIGNIASPDTYDYLCRNEICDYVRVGIGGGSCCTTSKKTGVHYPMGTLLMECNKIKKTYDNPIKIVADGGFDREDRIVKALALGADYVMCGKLFVECEESCALKTSTNHKIMYGMSTHKAQKEFGNTKLKAEEGITLRVEVNKTLDSLLESFSAVLRSAMSYTNSRTLDEFIGNVEMAIMA